MALKKYGGQLKGGAEIAVELAVQPVAEGPVVTAEIRPSPLRGSTMARQLVAAQQRLEKPWKRAPGQPAAPGSTGGSVKHRSVINE